MFEGYNGLVTGSINSYNGDLGMSKDAFDTEAVRDTGTGENKIVLQI